MELWPKIQQIYPDMKFKLTTFENTPENAREILANMGQNIDVIAGIFDETMLKLRGCDGRRFQENHFTRLCRSITGWQAENPSRFLIWQGSR